MLGIGIRVEELEHLVNEVGDTARLTASTAHALRSALASVELPITPAAVLERIAEDLDPLRLRLYVLLETLRDIAWNGPASTADLALIDPSDLPVHWAMAVIERRFAALDTASEGGRGDGHASSDDLAAAFSATDDPELAAAIARIGNDPLAFRVLDTGGDADGEPDGVISRHDLARVREHGIDGLDLSVFLGAVATAESGISEFDTAAHGGTGDGRFARSDLRAALASDSLSPPARAAASLLLEHDELLPLIERFAVHKGNLLFRLVRGAAGAAVSIGTYTALPMLPIFGFRLLTDTKDTLLGPLRFAAGVWDGAFGTVVGLGRLVLLINRLSPGRALIDRRGLIEEWRRVGLAVDSMVRHPGTMIEVLTDLETLENDPDRWLGRMAFTVFSGGIAREGAVALELEESLLLRLASARSVGFGAAAIPFRDLVDLELERREIAARLKTLLTLVRSRSRDLPYQLNRNPKPAMTNPQ